MMSQTKQSFKKINQFIQNNKDDLLKASSSKIYDLTGDRFYEKLDNLISKDGILRIGIVGQVKAGKSSFINAFLFDGKDVLPKASTPMTAALTVIKYSEKLSAEVEFYSEADWGIIERRAKEYEDVFAKIKLELEEKAKESKFNFIDTSDKAVEEETKLRVGTSIVSAYEVYAMAKQSGLDVYKYIGKKEKLSGDISSIDDLIGKLQTYVGVDGKFTPITRNTNLYLNIPTLKDIEIIDTPGTNDPIVSRGQVTRDFLSRCDTVFLLSSSGQFMGKEDAEFLVNTLPSEGIRNIILLGSKFDSVLLDEYKKYKGNIKDAMRDLYQKLSSQANDSIGKIIASNPNKPLMKDLQKREVKFISGICYNIAKKKQQNLDDMEQLVLDNLQKRYKFKFSDDILFDLANIDRIREKDLKEIKNDKDEILAEKSQDFLNGQKDLVLEELNILEDNLKERIKELETTDIEELRTQAEFLEDGFDRAKDGIKQVFIDFDFDIKGKIYKLINEIDDQRSLYSGVSRKRDSREEFSHTTGRWFWKETHYKTVYYDIANVNEAVDKAVKFIRETNQTIVEMWVKMINLQDIELKLIKEAENGFDMGDSSFNKHKIINPVKNALRAISLKPYRLKDKVYIEQITSAFSSDKVEGSDITSLDNLLLEILYKISEDIESSLNDKLDEISSILDEKSRTFVDTLKSEAENDINRIQEDLKAKESSLNRDKILITKIQQLKGEL